MSSYKVQVVLVLPPGGGIRTEDWSIYVDPDTNLPAQHMALFPCYAEAQKAFNSGAFFGVCMSVDDP